ncbi:MAG TPA: alpha/beta hydrolase [Vicinamibacterales bacterium]|nr:alpha/beta hydrolase [Vicinamibacterales bacterium]
MGTTPRRIFLKVAGIGGASILADMATSGEAQAQEPLRASVKSVETPVLSIAYEDNGDPRGFPVILLHGFPDDARAYDEVVPPLAKAGYRALVPFIRGYGATRFRDAAAPRMAEQAAIGQDVIDFADALKLPRFAVAGYDWGGRAAAIAAALHPERVRATVLIGGYTIQNTVTPQPPAVPEAEHRIWYQYYFNTERGRAGLEANRRAICRYLWQVWSPSWHFTDETYNRTAASFDNPDFVDVVIHSYRHRIMNAPGEPRFKDVEARLASRPKIQAPSITLYGADDGIARPSNESPPAERAVFEKLVARRVVPGVGHFMPRERPDAVSSAMLELLAASA